MASVTPRTNKDGTTTWRVLYPIGGKYTGDSFGDPGLTASENNAAAEEYAALVKRVGGAEARKILYSRRNTNGRIPTLAEFTARYLDPESGILTGVTDGTRDGYEKSARAFLPMLGEYPIDVIDKDAVGRWVAWQEKQPSAKFKGELIAAKTVKNRHALLSNILKLAVEKGYRLDNPAYRTRLSEGTPREPVFLSREEFRILYEAIPDFYKPHVAFLVGSQARWSEATALLGRDLHRDTNPPTVRINKAWKKPKNGNKTYVGTTKTKRGRRTVSLWPELVDLIGIPPTPDHYLLRGKRGGKLWYGVFNNRVWHPAVERSGLTSNPLPHDLRHTGASWLIADGKPLPFIQARLGHESIQTTINIYGHLLPDAHTQMADSLQLTMSNVLPALEA